MKNQVILIGHAGGEPETRAFPSGDLITTVSIATSEKWRDRETRELKERTEWHRVVFRDRGGLKLGDRARQMIRKGVKLFVQGAQRTRSWEKDGTTQRITEVDADEFLLLDAAGDRQAASAPEDSSAATWDERYPTPEF